MLEGLRPSIIILLVSLRTISSFSSLRVAVSMKAVPPQQSAPKRARSEIGTAPIRTKRGASPKDQNGEILSQNDDEPALTRTLEVKSTSTLNKLSVVEQIDALANAKARSGWLLRDGLHHIAAANNGVLLPLMERHGLPTCFTAETATSDRRSGGSKSSSAVQSSTDSVIRKPAAAAAAVKPPVKETAYLGLCRIIVGQQLAGAAAQAVSVKLLAHFGEGTGSRGGGLTPESFLAAVSTPAELETLRAAVG